MDGVGEGIELEGAKEKYICLPQKLTSYTYNRKCPVVVDKIKTGSVRLVISHCNLFFLKFIQIYEHFYLSFFISVLECSLE